MGEVSEAVKGKKKISPKLTEGNLVERAEDFIEELDGLVQKKDEDTLSEGKDAEPKNKASAARLRAALGLMRNAKQLLEDY